MSARMFPLGSSRTFGGARRAADIVSYRATLRRLPRLGYEGLLPLVAEGLTCSSPLPRGSVASGQHDVEFIDPRSQGVACSLALRRLDGWGKRKQALAQTVDDDGHDDAAGGPPRELVTEANPKVAVGSSGLEDAQRVKRASKLSALARAEQLGSECTGGQKLDTHASNRMLGTGRPRSPTPAGAVRRWRCMSCATSARHTCSSVQLGHTGGGALVMSTCGHPSDRAARARITAAMDGYKTGELRSFRGRGEA